MHDKICAGGADKMAGWKVALTLPHQYEPLKLSGPVFAGIYQSGVRQSGAAFEHGLAASSPASSPSWWRACRRTRRPARAYTADSIRGHVANLYCGMELVDNRYADVTKMTGPGRIADDVLQAACVDRHRDQGLAEARLPQPQGPLAARRQGARPRARQRRDGQRPDLARLARQQAHQARQDAEGGRRHPDRLGPSAGVPARHRAWPGPSSRGWAGRRSRSGRPSPPCGDG